MMIHKSLTLGLALTVSAGSLPTLVEAHAGNTSTSVVHACVKKGVVRIVGANARNCKRGERTLHWPAIGSTGQGQVARVVLPVQLVLLVHQALLVVLLLLLLWRATSSVQTLLSR